VHPLIGISYSLFSFSLSPYSENLFLPSCEIKPSLIMQLKHFALAAIVSAVSAQSTQSLSAVLAGNNQTSQLAALVGSLPGVLQQLGNATNITLLAPSNAALSALLNSTAGKALASNPDAVTAL
jgi:hypothetical protein